MAALSLAERQEIIENEFGVELRKEELRNLYGKHHITRQPLSHQVTANRIKPYEEELAELSVLKDKYLEYREAGYELVQYD